MDPEKFLAHLASSALPKELRSLLEFAALEMTAEQRAEAFKELAAWGTGEPGLAAD